MVNFSFWFFRPTKPKKRDRNKLLMLNQKCPIRHIICSDGLENLQTKFKMIVLFKGKCNGKCYQNKPWCHLEVRFVIILRQYIYIYMFIYYFYFFQHSHYIVNAVACTDHISRLIRRMGLIFYNSFLIDSVDRQNQVKIWYNMQKVNC